MKIKVSKKLACRMVKARRFYRAAKVIGKVSFTLFTMHWMSHAFVELERDTNQYLGVQAAAAMDYVAPAFGYERLQPNIDDLDAISIAEHAALERGLAPSLIRAIMKIESNNCTNNLSPVGAIGCMQVMPANAKRTGKSVEQLKMIRHNIQAGAQIIDEDIKAQKGNVIRGLQQYNGGPSCVQVIAKCGADVKCMGYQSENKKGCAESYYFAQNVLGIQARDIR